ncbi:hypothetical protein [Natrinema halophilum]|uniref:hypothetical protein n=1 Tax=Natrinema halophilum TaxID=1699371 RepID=UPI001F300FDF|nr:hypothetical protein [Natrinema halophilum]UHQ96479.1 hypothetical protein HYG82_23440 [Natrinema halophilum]
MTDHDLEIAPEAPTDAEGHPVHPDSDKSHRICAAQKSERTTPTEHGRERDDVPYCTLAAGWGVDEKSEGTCSHHLGAVDNRGENNGNYEHGAYSEFQDFMKESTLSEKEQAAMEALDLEDHGQDFAADVVRQAYLKYLRTHDDRFLREARQWASEFGVIEKPADKLEATVDANVDQTTTQELGEEEKEIARELIRQQQKQSAAGGDDE